MDARLRLNQLRRTGQKRGRVNDLRQLIASKNSRINKPKTAVAANSVKNRIGFKTKGFANKLRMNAVTQELEAKRQTKNQTKSWNANKKVTLAGDSLPKIMVDLTRIQQRRQTTKAPNVPKTNVRKTPAAQTPVTQSTSKNDELNTVIVSNLNKTITETDIKELFGEIGPLVSATKINTTVAVVVYRALADARNACQTYHNRLLDGLPMQCNILFHPNEEYVIEKPQPRRSDDVQPRRQQSTSQSTSSSYSTLLAAQLRQINEIPLQTNSHVQYDRQLYVKRFNR